MQSLAKRLMLSAVLIAGLMPAGPSIVHAQGVQLDLNGPKPKLRLVDPDDEDWERRRRQSDDDDDDFRDVRCNADRALDKAARLGVRRARVTSLGRRFIEVAGRRRGERVEITFARDRRCSIVE